MLEHGLLIVELLSHRIHHVLRRNLLHIVVAHASHRHLGHTHERELLVERHHLLILHLLHLVQSLVLLLALAFFVLLHHVGHPHLWMHHHPVLHLTRVHAHHVRMEVVLHLRLSHHTRILHALVERYLLTVFSGCLVCLLDLAKLLGIANSPLQRTLRPNLLDLVVLYTVRRVARETWHVAHRANRIVEHPLPKECGLSGRYRIVLIS